MTEQKPTEERRQQILSAAARCFARKGFYATTMDDIATESGLSKGSLYWYFASKDDLLADLTLWYLDSFTQQLQIVSAQPLTAREKMGSLLSVLGAGIEETRELLPIMLDFMSHSRHNPTLKANLQQAYTSWIEALAAILDQGIVEGQLPPFDTRTFSAVLIAAYDGLALQEMVLGPVDWQAVADVTTQVVMRSSIKPKGDDAA